MPRSFGYFVIQVYSPREFKVQVTLEVSKFSFRSYSFVISCSRSALVLRLGLLIFVLLSKFRRCLWFYKVAESCTQNMSTIKIYN